MGQGEHDPARRALQADKSLSPTQRVDVLQQAWALQYVNAEPLAPCSKDHLLAIVLSANGKTP